MTNPAIHRYHNAVQAVSPSFEIEGKVTEVLRGSGLAVIKADGVDEFTLNRGTDGIDFDALRVGQTVSCLVAMPGHRVLHAHQQTQPMHGRPESEAAAAGTMTKDEFIDEHCRRWGVKWNDISDYRVVVPHSDGVGWMMESVGQRDDDETVHGSLEPRGD